MLQQNGRAERQIKTIVQTIRILLQICFFTIPENPTTYEEAVRKKERDKWKEARNNELKVLKIYKR